MPTMEWLWLPVLGVLWEDGVRQSEVASGGAPALESWLPTSSIALMTLQG
jgi:hypothetical protein